MKHEKQIASRIVLHPPFEIGVDHNVQFLQLVARDKILQRRSTEPVDILDENHLKLPPFGPLDEFTEPRSFAV